jgi:hypothetical protein
VSGFLEGGKAAHVEAGLISGRCALRLARGMAVHASAIEQGLRDITFALADLKHEIALVNVRIDGIDKQVNSSSVLVGVALCTGTALPADLGLALVVVQEQWRCQCRVLLPHFAHLMHCIGSCGWTTACDKLQCAVG